MSNQTEALRAFWDVATLEKAQHERVTVPASPDFWSDDFQESANASIIACFRSPPLTILDYGCGVGRVARQFLRSGYDIVGVDVSPNMLSYAERYCRPYVGKWLLTDGYAISLPDASVQGAYSFYVFQHMSSLEMVESALHEIHRCLSPGGIFLLQTIDNLTLGPETVAPSFVGVRQTPEQVRGLVLRAGFRILTESLHEAEDHVQIYLHLAAA